MGSPLQLYDDPDNLFVAGFIGSPKMNLLAATRQGDRLVLPDCGGQTVPLPPLAALPAEGVPLHLGLRPQAISMTGAQSIALVVEVVEHLGSETLVHARAPGSAELVTALVTGGRTLTPGQPFAARFDTAALYLFDPTGQRLR